MPSATAAGRHKASAPEPTVASSKAQYEKELRTLLASKAQIDGGSSLTQLTAQFRLVRNAITFLFFAGFFAPLIQFLLEPYSAVLGPVWGPLITESLTVVPIVLLAAAAAADSPEGVKVPLLPKFLADALPGMGLWGLFTAFENLARDYVLRFAGRSQALARRAHGGPRAVATSASRGASAGATRVAQPAHAHPGRGHEAQHYAAGARLAAD